MGSADRGEGILRQRKRCFIRTCARTRKTRARERKKASMFPVTSISTSRLLLALPVTSFASMSVAKDTGKVIAPTHYAFRSFDRQWIIPDASRIINQPNPTLWNAWSDKQVFRDGARCAFAKIRPRAVALTGLIPDLRSLQRLLRRPRVSALGRRAGDAIERARGRVAGAGQGARRAGRARRRHRLYRCGHGASGLHRSLPRRSRPAGPARAADRREGAVRRGGRARARSGVAPLLRRALRRRRRRPAERPAAPAPERTGGPQSPPTAPFPARPNRCPRP